MYHAPIVLILTSLTLIGCGFLDDDLHRSHSELEFPPGSMSGSFSTGGSGSGVGFGHSCGCGGWSRSGGPIHLGESHIRGAIHRNDENAVTTERRSPAQRAPDTPVESLAEHADRARTQALIHIER